MRTAYEAIALVIASLVAPVIWAESVMLQQPTATYSQTQLGFWSVAHAIDADTDNSGWAVQRADGFGSAEIAVFETVQDIGFSAGTELTVRLQTHLVNSDGPHNLGRFRLSVTSDDRSSFADGLGIDGDVTANWQVLQPLTTASAAGAVLTVLPDGSLLASGTDADTETHDVTARTLLPRITGIRLETLNDDSLPHGGPGRAPNGNFVLVDFRVSAEPIRSDLVAAIRVSCVEICWPGLSNRVYQIQYSSMLTSNHWINLGLPVQGTGTNCLTEVVGGAERRFYRVIDSPQPPL